MRRKEIPPRLKINVTNRRALELGALEYLRRPLDVLETRTPHRNDLIGHIAR